MGVMTDRVNVRSFALNMLWEVEPAPEVIWVMVAGHSAAVWILEKVRDRSARFGVVTKEELSDSSGL